MSLRLNRLSSLLNWFFWFHCYNDLGSLSILHFLICWLKVILSILLLRSNLIIWIIFLKLWCACLRGKWTLYRLLLLLNAILIESLSLSLRLLLLLYIIILNKVSCLIGLRATSRRLLHKIHYVCWRTHALWIWYSLRHHKISCSWLDAHTLLLN
jgi:hypothetical protein